MFYVKCGKAFLHFRFLYTESQYIFLLNLMHFQTEILKRQASPAMRLLNDLLMMHDGFDDEGWLKACKKRMIETFPREDPFSLLVPAGFDLDKVQTDFAKLFLRNSLPFLKI